METVIRNVDEINPQDRQSLEHLLGRPLGNNQRVVINTANLRVHGANPPAPDSVDLDAMDTLPEWCNVYKGLSDDQVSAIERTILNRANLSRRFE